MYVCGYIRQLQCMRETTSCQVILRFRPSGGCTIVDSNMETKSQAARQRGSFHKASFLLCRQHLVVVKE
jgi:hypothetical protein